MSLWRVIGFHIWLLPLWLNSFRCTQAHKARGDMLLERLNWYSISFCSFDDDLFVVVFLLGQKCSPFCTVCGVIRNACHGIFMYVFQRLRLLCRYSFFIFHLPFRHRESLLGRTFSAHFLSLSLRLSLINRLVPRYYCAYIRALCLATKWIPSKDTTIMVWFAFITVNLHVFWCRKYIYIKIRHGNDMRFDVPHTHTDIHSYMRNVSRIAH